MSNIQFFLDQHGCAKNQVDGELIITKLLEKGFSRTENPADANLIIVNSCGFIEDAKKESIDAVIDWKNQYPNAKILLAGCLAERYHTELQESLPEVDGFFGNGDVLQVAAAVDKLFTKKEINTFFPQVSVSAGERKTFLSYPRSAFVKITEGCDNKCTYCAIPLIRGNLRSRSIASIVDEIKQLLSQNIFEFNLIGQDLASYGCEKTFSDNQINDQKSPLYFLLKELSKIEGDFWIRLLYIHPDHFPLEILELIQKDKRILPYFDIPFQHADELILKKMNRKGSFEKYTQLISNIKNMLPSSVIRTTFLVGFPSETNENFQLCADFLAAIEPDWSGAFAYSKEEDTPAYFFKPAVSKKLAQERKKQLEDLQDAITEKRLKNHVGKKYSVLVEEILPPNDEDDSDIIYAIGRCWFQAPDVDGITVVRYTQADKNSSVVFAGAVIEVKITESDGSTLQSILL
ncbi:MAG: 30S ribosomal protein S12 methylthiotransferase RimO [Treponemataceae bacterium]